MTALTEILTAAGTRAAFSLRALTGPQRLSVLIFHRVHARTDPMFPFEPDAERFDALMRLLAASFRVMDLDEAARHLAERSLPPRSLVITFDDGYADNAEVALPILHKHGLKACFYVSTGFLEGGRMWNDSVIEIIRATRRDQLDLEAFGLARQELGSLAQRQQLLDKLLPRIKYLDLAGREEALARLAALAGVSSLPTTLMMSHAQVRQLHRAGMQIGAHTVRHPILCTLDDAQSEREIQAGREALEAIIDAPVRSFAYPNGRPGRDYESRHVALVKRLGFASAVTTAPGAAQSGDDLFQLPRYTPFGRHPAIWSARLLNNLSRNDFERVGALPAAA